MGEPVGVGEVDDAPLFTTEYRKEKTGQVTWSSKFFAEYVNDNQSMIMEDSSKKFSKLLYHLR